MKYLEYVKELNKKYGKVDGTYFTDKNCKTVNSKIKKGNQGLYLHHVKENEFTRLGYADVALQLDFSNQEGKNLVYCNIFEHFLLHQKIILDGYQPKQFTDEKHLEGVIEHIAPKVLNLCAGKQFLSKMCQYEQKIIPKHKDEFIKEFAKLVVYIQTSQNENAKELRQRFKDLNYPITFPEILTANKPYMKKLVEKNPNASWIKNTLQDDLVIKKTKESILKSIQKEINVLLNSQQRVK